MANAIRGELNIELGGSIFNSPSVGLGIGIIKILYLVFKIKTNFLLALIRTIGHN